MIQTNKEYQRDYFEAEGYKIFENIEEATETFCKLCPHISAAAAVESIEDDTNCDWVILNDGSVAVLPLAIDKQLAKLHDSAGINI